MRPAKDSDFFIELPGVGIFRFGRRTFLDRAKIRSEFLRITKELGDDDLELSSYAAAISVHKVLCVDAPAGWDDIESIELGDDTDAKIFELYQLLQDKELTFRSGAIDGSEAPRPGVSQ